MIKHFRKYLISSISLVRLLSSIYFLALRTSFLANSLYKDNLIKLDSDTENIVEYVQNNNKKNKKKYNFWNLLTNKI